MNYLNRKQKEILTHLSALHTFLNDVLEDWEELDRPTKQIKYAKMARSFAFKVMEIMEDGIDKKQIDSLINEIKKKELVLVYSSEAKRLRKKKKQFEDTTVMKTDDLYDLINITLAGHCVECENGEEDIQNCVLKDLLLKYDIPVLTEENSPGECPYQYKGGQDNG